MFCTKIHRLVWTGGVLDCFRGCDRAPCRGWIPAFAGMTEVGDFGVLRRMALNMLKAETRSQGGVAAKRKRAGWDEDYLLLVLAN